MTRLIDADVLMQKIETYLPTFNINPSKIVELVETAPTEERPHGEWIPCSEKLPEETGYYLVSDMYGSVYATGFDNKDGFGYYDDDGYFVEKEAVVAWMPLPEPYKERGKENVHYITPSYSTTIEVK